MLDKIVGWLEKLITPVSRLANYIGISMLIVLIVLTVAEVLMRFFVGISLKGSKELSEYALGILVFLTLPYCAVRCAHIVVDIATMKLSNHIKALIDTVVYFLSVILCGLLAWQLFVRGIHIAERGEVSTMLQVWLSPFVIISAIGFILLTLVYIYQWLRAIKETRQ